MEPLYFVKIGLMANHEITIQSNAPPGHFIKMLKSAEASMVEQFIKQESQAGIIVPPPGTKLR